MINRFFAIFSVCCLLLLCFYACKTIKPSREKGRPVESINLKEVIFERADNKPVFETMEGKISLTLQNKEKKFSARGTLRINKDSIIQLSVQPFGFEVFRLVVTPERITCIDRMNQYYFQESLSTLSPQWQAILNYSTFESLLTNQVFLYSSDELKSSDYNLFRMEKTDTETLTLSEKNQPADFSSFFSFDNQLNLKETTVRFFRNSSYFICKYDKFDKKHGSFYFPEFLSLDIVFEGNNQVALDMRFNSFSFNKSFVTSDAISSKYTRISKNELLKLIRNL